MRYCLILLSLVLIPAVCMTVPGCGSSEPTVVQPTPEMDAAVQSEAAAAEAAMETSDE